MKKKIVLVIMLSLVSAVFAEDPNYTASSLQGLDETSGYYYTATMGGAAGGTNGVNYLNVENRYEDYKCWGAIRFDLNTIRETLNTQFGAGNWEVQKVVLSLWETASSFCVPGEVEVRFTDDDTTKITKADSSPLVLNEPSLDPINGQFVNDTYDGSGTYVKMISYSKLSGYPEVKHVLFLDGSVDNTDGSEYIAEHIAGSNYLTLAFVDDGSVKAGWVGYGSSYTTEHPKLTVVGVARGHVASCVNRPTMDFNNDCKVNFLDFAQFAGQWLDCGFEDPADCQ